MQSMIHDNKFKLYTDIIKQQVTCNTIYNIPTGLVLGGAISRNKTLQLIPNVFQNKCAKKPRRNRLTKIHLEKWLLKHRQLCEMEYK